ncbi:MAG: VOC family protein [Massilia sp.]
MSKLITQQQSSVAPCLRYRDAAAAITWLCANFGFEEHMVVRGDAGRILHAQLTRGGGMIMLGSTANDNEYGKWVVQPEDVGGKQTQTIYLAVADADEVYQQAKKAGARIVIEIADADYGGRGFTCLDCEGHVWDIGTYNPWQEQGGSQAAGEPGS